MTDSIAWGKVGVSTAHEPVDRTHLVVYDRRLGQLPEGIVQPLSEIRQNHAGCVSRVVAVSGSTGDPRDCSRAECDYCWLVYFNGDTQKHPTRGRLPLSDCSRVRSFSTGFPSSKPACLLHIRQLTFFTSKSQTNRDNDVLTYKRPPRPILLLLLPPRTGTPPIPPRPEAQTPAHAARAFFVLVDPDTRRRSICNLPTRNIWPRTLASWVRELV